MRYADANLVGIPKRIWKDDIKKDRKEVGSQVVA
jgi:hypothetical protein